MICPFRNGIKYEVKTIASAPVIVDQVEYYPECYEGDCPYYDYYGKCTAINNEE